MRQGRELRPKHIYVPALGVVPAGASIVILIGSGLSAIGWIADVPRLTDWYGDGITIKFNTAVGLAAAAAALLLSSVWPKQKSLIRVLAGFALLVGALTLLQHIFHFDLGIDTLFFGEAENAPATASPGRMGPPASLSLTIIGIALVLATYRDWRRTASSLVLIPLFVTGLSLTGFLFGADILYSVPKLTGIALQTATMMLILSIGFIALIRDHGLASIFLRNDAGGLMFRRIVFPVILISFLLGSLRLMGQNAGYFDTAFGTAMRTLAEIVLTVGLLWLTAESISRLEKEAGQAREAKAENETHKRIATAQESERRRIARDLHDHLGQQFTAMRLRLDPLLETDLKNAASKSELESICEQAKKLDADLSLLVWQMRPGVLDTHGLTSALTSFVREWSANHDIEVDFHSNAPEARFPSEIETNLYRIIQEALNNVVKHANAKKVSITFNHLPEEAIVIIEDDGDGFDPEGDLIHRTEGSGFGLLGMKERATLIGGTFDIESTSGGGTAVLLRVPRPSGRSPAAAANGDGI
jgi:signal transduction histidine kinase